MEKMEKLDSSELPKKDEQVNSVAAGNPVIAVTLMVQEAELLRINAATAAATYILPDEAAEKTLRDLSPLGK